MKTITAIFMTLLTPLSANALNVFACEPEWGALVKELAGDIAEITVATTAFQDPHKLQARPSLIAAVRRADLLICTGAQLEIGWLPLLLRRSANPHIQVGDPGYFLAADFVEKSKFRSSSIDHRAIFIRRAIRMCILIRATFGASPAPWQND